MKIRNEAKIGLFALITLGALYWGINFLRGQDLFNRYSKYYAQYEQVNGVQKSSPVVVKGVKVGVVSRIDYDPSKSDKITLEFNIRAKYYLPKDSKATIFSDGIMGGKAIEIVLGESSERVRSGDTLTSRTDKGIFEMASSEIEFFKQRVDKLVNSMTTTLESLNTILVNNTSNIAVTLSNVADASGSLKNIISSEEMAIRGIIQNLNTLSATLGNSSGKIDNIITNVEGLSDSLRTQIPTIVGNLSGSLDELNTIFSKVNSNEGTLGKLVNDDELHNSLVEASANLSKLLEDVKANPGRYVNISVFGRKNK